MPTLTLPNDLVLAYDDQGSREARPIVLIHGVCMSRRFFHKQLEPLAREHRVLAVDLRGHGDSTICARTRRPSRSALAVHSGTVPYAPPLEQAWMPTTERIVSAVREKLGLAALAVD